MKCPFCNTDNTDDRDVCYHCNKDLSMLRLIINKAKHHYNVALEHAERGRYYEAITELQNAIDLDRTHTNARVVLGTIYARQNKFDKAIKEWNEALALDGTMLKAHDYIIKAQRVSEALPVIRWVKVFAVALVLSIIVIISLLLGGKRQTKDLPMLQTAWKAYNNHNYRVALPRLDELIKTSTDDSVRLSSLVLRDTINNSIRSSINNLKKELVAGNLWQVIDELKKWDGVTLDAETDAVRSYIAEEARLRLINQSLGTIQHYLQTGEGFDEAHAEVLRVAERFKGSESSVELLQGVHDMEEKCVADQLAQIEKEYKANGDAESARMAAQVLMSRFGTLQATGRVREFTLDLDKKLSAEYLDRVEAALAKQHFSRAYAALGEARQLAASDQETSHRIALLTQRLHKEEVAAFLEKLRTLNRQKQYEEALAIADGGTTAPLDAEQQEVLQQEVVRARQGSAVAIYRWMEARDSQFEEGRISTADAEKTRQRYQFVLDNLPSSTLKWARDNILFYAGVASIKLGKREEANSLFETLQHDYPKSSYLEFVPKIRERFGN